MEKEDTSDHDNTYPCCKANVVDHGKYVGRAKIATGHECLQCICVNNLQNVNKRILYFQERKMHMCQEFGKLDFQKRKMLTTIATDGAGVIFVT